jgi:hypothetical protein
MASDRFARPWLQLGCFAGFVANSFRKVTPLWGSFHANLGSVQDAAGFYATTRGLAWERSLGQVTLHLESFAQQHAKPTRAIGLRHDLLPQLQVDASWGRQAGQTLTTAGLKWMF